jgi:hypothetical protein
MLRLDISIAGIINIDIAGTSSLGESAASGDV